MEKVVERRKKSLGEDHLDTTNSMHWLAHFYYGQNCHSEAIELMENVVERRKKSLGVDHLHT